MEHYEIKQEELDQLISAINKKYNYDYSNHAASSFKRRVERIMNRERLTSIDTLIHNLISSQDYYNFFMKEITVNTTEMFRDPIFWKKLRTEVLPFLSVRNNIRIWHAACSTGEEVYSMAILLKEAGLLDRTSLIATDINEDVLEIARKGCYNSMNMQVNDENYKLLGSFEDLKNYYTINEDGKICINSDLRENITFSVHDLIKDKPFSKFDLILCRNVLIYFNDTLQDNILDTFKNSLYNNSFLGIGLKESIAWCRNSIAFQIIAQEERIYKKGI